MNDETLVGFVLNGQPVEVEALRDEPLLYILRDRLGLMGTRLGCGLNQCGACRVEIDGRLQAACDTPAWSIVGRSVTTIEGLEGDSLHPVQEALLRFQAGQCGACLSGIIITLSHLIRRDDLRNEADVRAQLDQHLCRCGSHQRIMAAVMSLIEPRLPHRD